MDQITRDDIKGKIQKLIDAKTLKNEDELKDIELDKVEALAHKLDVCPMDLVIYLTCGGNCKDCDREYKCASENDKN